jgi:flagellar protein FlaG
MSELIVPAGDARPVISISPAPARKESLASQERVVPLVDTPEAFDAKAIREDLRRVIEQLNEQVQKNGRGLVFSVDERLNRQVITVRSTTTGEIVRQIPNEVVLKVAHNIEDVKGLLLDGAL